MKTFLSTWWEKLGTSYWFLPSLIALGAIGLSALTLHIDGTISPQWARNTAWIWAGGAQGARNVLETIASSTITVAGVVFSITIVTLTLASSQFGPRLLRNFMNDRGTQLVLGVFVGTFLYCLLVLRAIRGLDQTTVVPFLSVTCGVAFAVASVGFLIFFIHHISTSIIAENVIGRVAADLMSEIDSLYPEKARVPGTEKNEDVPERFEHRPACLYSRKSGFIQAIAMETLLDLANAHDLLIRLHRRPGGFVAEGALLAEIIPGPEISEDLRRKMHDAIFFGRSRTPTQDIEYSIDQLVEVALRALSPGINDPFTAISCIEWLGAALIRVAGREIPSRWRRNDDGKLRILTDATDFEGIAGAALNQLRQYGKGSVAVTIRLLEVLGRVGPHIVRSGDREVLLAHVRAIRDDGIETGPNDRDRAGIEESYARAVAALDVGKTRA
jgi:uncharacterized membrane protein